MKTITLFRVAAALAAMHIITAYKQPAAIDQQAPFADKYWLLVASTVVPAVDLNMDGKPDSDIRVMLEDCAKDDAEMFKTGGKLMKHHGASKCEEDEETIEESGDWQYNAAAQTITSHHYDTDKAQTVTLKEVSPTKMVVSYTFQSSKGSHTITATYKAK